jgi:hypothetical protein
LRRTGEDEEGSGDSMATVAGFGTGAVVGTRRWIAEGGSGEVENGDGWVARSFVYQLAGYGWVLLFVFSFLFFLVINKRKKVANLLSLSQ